LQIDWFTLIAQVVNFVILLLLLKHFLFDRIVATMDERREKIAKRLSSAEEKEKEAEEQLQTYRRQQQELEGKRDEILAEAREEARQKRQDMLEEARQEVEKQKHNWQQSLERQRESFAGELRQQLGEQVYAVSRRVLSDLADSEVEKQIVEKFVQQLGELDDDKRKLMASAIKELKGDLKVATSFEPSAADKKKITEAIRSELADGVQTSYEVSSDFVGGIVIDANSQRLAWTIDGYLRDLESQLSETLRNVSGDRSTSSEDKS
jgi:F-type H+-transporting ATPase subunit b